MVLNNLICLSNSFAKIDIGYLTSVKMKCTLFNIRTYRSFTSRYLVTELSTDPYLACIAAYAYLSRHRTTILMYHEQGKQVMDVAYELKYVN